MLVYQAVIMFLVIGIVFILAFVLRIKRRLLLAVIIVVLVIGGSLILSLIQYSFGVIFYEQKCDVSYYDKIRLNAAQKDHMGEALSGFQDVTATQEQYRSAFSRDFKADDGSVHSTIKVTYARYKKKNDAEKAFQVRQIFYENKLFMPKYNEKTKIGNRNAPLAFEYITSYIRSNYPNYNDIIYLPSKLYYVSEVVIKDNDMIIDLYETSNKHVTEKNKVMAQISQMLAKKG